METSCSIRVSEDSTYIIMKQTGIINKNLGVAYNIEAHKIAMKYRINKYLVDLTEAKNMDTFINKYEFAYKDIQNLPEIFKKEIVAMVVAPDDHSHDFVEKISRKIGFNVIFFRNIVAAEEYIKTAALEEQNDSGNISDEINIFSPAPGIKIKNSDYNCPMCDSNEFEKNAENIINTVVCLNCGISYTEKEISKIKKDNSSFILDIVFNDQLEELPPFSENNSECL